MLIVTIAKSRTIRYIQISNEEYIATLESLRLPPEFVSLIDHLFSEVLDGRNAHVADGVQRALGRPPRDFADYARDAAASGGWAPTSLGGGQG